MRRRFGGGSPIAFHVAMWGLTMLACAGIVGLYFGWQGTRLLRLPARYSGDWIMERDEEIGFVPARNAATEIRYVGGGGGFHVFTDGRRARVDAPGLPTPAHVAVMTLGCSFTWGAGVESPDTYSQQLGRMLGVSVANFGMGSYGSVQAFQTLVRNLELKPDVIVYGFIQDHLRRNVSPCAPNYVPYCLPVSYLVREGDWVVLRPPPMEYFSPEDNRAFNAEVVLRDPSGFGSWLLAAKWAAKIAIFRYRAADTIAIDDSPETAVAAMKAMIGAMGEEAQHIGARLVVLNMPNLPRGRVQPVPAALARAVAGKDLTFVDFSPVASAYYANDATGTLIQGDDPHPNPRAHRMIAETLAPMVRSLIAQRVDGTSASGSQ